MRSNKVYYSEETVEKMIAKLNSGSSIEEICKEYGICQATFYNWKKKYTIGSKKQDLMILEEENIRLKKNVCRA